MKSTSNLYRFSGLIAVLGLFTLLLGLIVMILLPDIRLAAWGLLALGIILLAIAFIIDFRRVSYAMTGKRGRFSTGTTVMVSVFIGIILLVNAISIANYQRFELTGLAQFALTSQTKEVLSKLATPVQALGFLVPKDTYGLNSYVTSFLGEYQKYSDRLSVEFIDPDEHPDQARQYGVEIYPAVVFETQLGRRLVSPQEMVQMGRDQQGNPQIVGVEAEHAFTSAILEVTGTVQKKVYFLTGHGESDINSNYSDAKKGLQDNLYRVDTLDLAENPSIPDDAAALIITGPQEPIPTEELVIMARYLVNGGPALILVDPGSPPEIKQLLSMWGVVIGDGSVIDPSSYLRPSRDIPRVPRTRNAFALSGIYFPGATPIIPYPEYVPITTTAEGEVLPQIIWASENSSIQMYMLIWTSDDSWLEKNFDPLKESEFDEGTDIKGPLALGFLIFTSPSSEGEQGAALIVIGDSDFASNEHFYNGSNSDLFLSAVNWLAAGKELISIDRKVLPFRRLIIGPEAANFINYSSIGLMPLLVLVVGGIIWWRRR